MFVAHWNSYEVGRLRRASVFLRTFVFFKELLEGLVKANTTLQISTFYITTVETLGL